MPFDSSPRSFRGARLATITTLRPIKCLRRVGLGDPGQNLPHFRPDINFQTQEFVGFGHTLGDFHDAHAQVDLGKIVDGDLAVISRGRCVQESRRLVGP